MTLAQTSDKAVGQSQATKSSRFGIDIVPPYWQQPLSHLALSWLALCLLFWSDLSDMVTIWWNVSTYNHILLIPSIIGWLVWQYLPQLKNIFPRFSFFGALWLLGGALAWVIGEASGIALFRHIAFVVMLQGSAMAFCGIAASRILIFPLLYAFFLVPVGEEIVPWLQTVTADISMILLGWANIPAFREGVFISTPTGYFEVAEACSGVKFLIAMIAYGVLVAHVCFQSWLRRIAFLIACFAFPILANGVRAWGTIYIAHHYSLDFATGFDHVFYGWFFFAFVLIAVMGTAWPFFDRGLDDLGHSDISRFIGKQSMTARSYKPLAITAAIIALPMLWFALTTNASAVLPEQIKTPNVSAWQASEDRFNAPWQPIQKGAAHEIMQSYVNKQGAKVTLYFALYDRQSDGKELIGYGQGAFDPESEWAWAANGTAIGDVPSIRLTAPGPVHREAASIYIYGDTVSASATRIKIAMLQDRLIGRHQPAGVLIVSSEDSEGMPAAAAMQAFVDDNDGLEQLARKIASGQ
ncbi:exosortase A [Parasphingorhabdus sp. DH2-15]|uniref:exosortase A n=1 Tax=Parasphingorhabdus sp. DH2-15 TaxID=3444112 RepID=UPI003F687B4B